MCAMEMVRKPKRVCLKGLPPLAFQHPLDLKATESLKKIKGFDWFAAKFIEYGIERIEYVNHVGGAIRVGPKQYAKHYNMLLECCEILDVAEPEMYVMQGRINAYTSGHNHPFIVLQTGLLELMEDDEAMAVIAHELGHIKCGHALYKTMARGIKPLLEIAGKAMLGVGGLVGASIEAGLSAWNRRSELSADRAALLATQEAQPCVTMLMKLAGGTERHVEWLDAEQFLNQARAYREGMDDKMSDRFYRFMANVSATHPRAVERARALDEWVGSPQYNLILAGNYSGIEQLARQRVCPTCGQPAKEGEKFCSNDATPLAVH